MTYYGLYKITNLTNGKMYIGQHKTSNLDDGYMGSGTIIKLAIQKYGIDNFRKEWLMFCEDADELNYMERVFVDQTWLDRSDTYNLSLGGEVYTISDEQKKKISESLKGKPSPKKGMQLSYEQKERIRQAKLGAKNPMFGKKFSAESRQNRSNSLKGHVGYWIGKKQDKQTVDKRSTNIRGKKHWNNGIIDVFSVECPEGFVRGKLHKTIAWNRGMKK